MAEEKKKSVYNQKKNQYTQEYIRNNYKQLSIRLPKEGVVTREKIMAAAEQSGMSVNAYIVEAVLQRMQKDGFQFDKDVVE